MKPLADQILEDLSDRESDLQSDISLLPFSKDDIAKAFERKLDQYDFDAVRVDDIDIDLEGNIIVAFEDIEGDELEIVFQVDEEEDAIIALLAEDESEGLDDEILMVDLTALAPSVVDVPLIGVRYVNLTDLSWLNKSTLTSLLQVGDIGVDSDGSQPAQIKQDAFGNSLGQDLGALESYNLEERSAIVVRGGSRVKLPIVRRRRKRRLTAAQRSGLRRAALKRKSKKSQIQRARKKSLKLRGRLKLKRAKSGSRSTYKVKGT